MKRIAPEFFSRIRKTNGWSARKMGTVISSSNFPVTGCLEPCYNSVISEVYCMMQLDGLGKIAAGRADIRPFRHR
jgi:hypothetical protein